jgi:hypothetical protein
MAIRMSWSRRAMLYGTWRLLASSSRYFMVFLGSRFWIYMDLYGSIWIYMDLYGSMVVVCVSVICWSCHSSTRQVEQENMGDSEDGELRPFLSIFNMENHWTSSFFTGKMMEHDMVNWCELPWSHGKLDHFGVAYFTRERRDQSHDDGMTSAIVGWWIRPPVTKHRGIRRASSCYGYSGSGKSTSRQDQTSSTLEGRYLGMSQNQLVGSERAWKGAGWTTRSREGRGLEIA